MKTNARGSSRASLALLVVLAVAGGAGRAAATDDEARARAHFEEGQLRYNLADYPAALREFAAGYRLAPRPQFLVNLGQVYRRLGQLARAREMYRRFLVEAPAGDRARSQVRRLIDEVEHALTVGGGRQPPVLADPLAESNTPFPVPTATATPGAEPAPPPAGFWQGKWWILPVVGVGLAGAVVGVYFAARGSGSGPDCGAAELGCLDLKR